MSFAIPSKVVRNIIEQLRDNGEVVRGWLGVSIQNVDRTLAESFGLDRPRGALVAQVGEDSPASRADIQSGDIIVEVDGESIEVSADLPHVIGLISPGSTVSMTLIRDGDEETLDVEIGALEAGQTPSVVASASEPGVVRALGMAVRELNRDEDAEADLRGGVVVMNVDRNSPAFEAGVRGGDVITRFGKTAISRLRDMEEALEDIESGDSISVRLIRQGAPLFIGIKVPEND